MITLVDLCEKLKEEDEVLLLEKLKLTSENLVDRCIDIVEEDFDSLVIEYEENNEQDVCC